MAAPHVQIATAARSLLKAARRAHERGDTPERDRLMDEADEQITAMVAAMPKDKPQ